MPRPPTDRQWVHRVKAMRVNHPKLSAEGIAKALEPGGPSGRQVRRILQRWDPSPEERRDYAIFRWPESMESGALPWEASRDLLDLQQHMLGKGTEIPVRFARSYWRACLAMPDADIESRRNVASHLAMWEVSGNSPAARREPLHWYLTYAPWRSPENMTAYLTATSTGAPDAPKHFTVAFWIPEDEPADVGEMMGACLGIHDPAAVNELQEMLRRKHERKAK